MVELHARMVDIPTDQPILKALNLTWFFCGALMVLRNGLTEHLTQLSFH